MYLGSKPMCSPQATDHSTERSTAKCETWSCRLSSYGCLNSALDISLTWFPELVILNLDVLCCDAGDWTIFFCWHVKNFFLLHCVPLYVCRLCINYQDLRTKLLGVGALRMLLLTFISTLVIDFLSIRKVIIFSAIDR